MVCHSCSRVNRHSTYTQEEENHTQAAEARHRERDELESRGQGREEERELQSVLEGEAMMPLGNEAELGGTRWRRWRCVERHVDDEMQRRLCQQSNKWVSERHRQRERERVCQTESEGGGDEGVMQGVGQK